MKSLFENFHKTFVAAVLATVYVIKDSQGYTFDGVLEIRLTNCGVIKEYRSTRIRLSQWFWGRPVVYVQHIKGTPIVFH